MGFSIGKFNKNLRKITRFIYMVQVCSQKMSMFKKVYFQF